jgi:hemoglobin-like flavoprotein
LVSCGTKQALYKSINKDDFDKALADSVLAYALDHEALYSLADTLKPISSVKFLRFNVAKDSTMRDGDKLITTSDSLLQKIESYQKVCKALSKGDFEFILMPFARTEKTIRNLEIYVVRKSRLSSILKTHASFFGQWGFTPTTNAAVVLTAIEYESRLDRNRAYGYLFGYPSYAVDFFVESTKKQETDPEKKLVARDFFAIPVFAGNKGYFTYAMPKGYKTTSVDSTIYNKAAKTLTKYKNLREKYKTDDGLKALKLWMSLNRIKND